MKYIINCRKQGRFAFISKFASKNRVKLPKVFDILTVGLVLEGLSMQKRTSNLGSFVSILTLIPILVPQKLQSKESLAKQLNLNLKT